MQIRQPALPTAKPSVTPSAYVLLSLPLGIFYFVFIVAGLTLSAGLLPIFVGLPILLGVLTILFGIAGFERSLARAVLGLDDPEPSSASAASESGLFRRLGRAIADPASYLNILLCILKLPIGIVNFVVSVTLVCVSIGLIATPAVYVVLERTIDIDIFEMSYWLADLAPNVTSLQLSFVCTAVGIVLLLLSVAAIRAMAAWTARFTLAMARAPR
ncbi:sensor domain-containing protein [Paenibacillus sp.]|uniref:sensor domain-containing protein n=1 Tax=Paenibacillus sp. TaxID=58172 RepID=UPI0028123F45|nr:sensor domain-containing protein [Paenibacillus sp.]